MGGQTRAAFRIGLVIRAVIGNTAYDFLWIIATSEGALRVCPIRTALWGIQLPSKALGRSSLGSCGEV